MCGIIGYVGKKNISEILINGLFKLEYRGYDSAGIAILTNKKFEIVKSIGKIDKLKEKVWKIKTCDGVGIGHTRWATHGKPNQINAHPHESNTVAIVHNGIIENYQILKENLINNKYIFKSNTDSEVVAHLLDYHYEPNFVQTISNVTNKLEGSYAFGIINKNEPDKLYAVRKESPLIIGIGENENFIASDVTAILPYTNKIIYLENNNIAKITNEDIVIYNDKLETIEYQITIINMNNDTIQKGSYKHFMLKEIYEQPAIIKNILNEYTYNNLPKFNLKKQNKFNKIFIVACGTAYHAGLCAKDFYEEILQIPVTVNVASEFRYANSLIDSKTLVIIISQSGETADSLAALRLSKQKKSYILAIINVPNSSIAREADEVIYTHAGTEISVASTKAFTSQITILYLLGIHYGLINKKIDTKIASIYINELLIIPPKMKEVLKNNKQILNYANKYYKKNDIYYLGRNIDYPIALEASLKLKEISYIHAEGFAAGELKHGSIALISKGTPVIIIGTVPQLMEKLISNIEEVNSRGAETLLITNQKTNLKNVINIPKTIKYFSPLISIIPLQLFAYYIADLKQLDVDKPRNLAKSVTVE